MKQTLTILIIILYCISVPDSVFSQSPSLEDEAISQHANELDPSFTTLAIENDLFGSGTDKHYTNGIRLSWFEAGAVPPSWISHIGELYPGFRLNDTTSVTFSIGQNLYTPSDIKIATEQKNDRPWAAWLYGSTGLVTITDNHVDEIEMALGVVGPAALGEQTQKYVHDKISNSPEPKGWEHQLDNEIGLNLSWQRRWPEYKTWNMSNNLWLQTSPPNWTKPWQYLHSCRGRIKPSHFAKNRTIF